MSKLLTAFRQAFDQGVITTSMVCMALLLTFMVDRFTQADLRVPLRALDVLCVCALLLWQFRRIQQHRNRDRLFKSIVDAVPHILFYKDARLRYRKINAAFEDAFSVRATEVEGLQDRDLFGEALHTRFNAQDRDLLQTRQVRVFDERLEIHGESRHLQSYKRPIYDANGRPLGIVGLAIDVTEQELLQQQLRDAHARLNVALQAASMGVWEWNPDTDQLKVDAAARALLHLGAEEQLGEAAFARMTPGDAERVRSLLHRVGRTREPVEYEFRIKDPAGCEHWLEGFAVAHDSPQMDHCLIGILRDITERQRSRQALAAAKMQAEEALQALAQSRVDLEMALSAGGLGVWASTTQLDRHCPLVQPAFLAAPFTADETALAICGFPPGAHLSHQDYIQTIHPDDRDKALSTLDEAQGDGTRVFRDQYRVVRPDGEIRNVDLRGSVTSEPIDPQYRRVTLTGIVKDITEEESLKASLSAKAEEARHARDAKSRFLAMMSHEVRTPLNGVLGILDLVIDSPLTEEQHHLLTLCQQSAQGLLSIVNDILDFSKIEAGQLQVEAESVSVSSLVTDVCAQFEHQAARKELAIHVQLDEHLPRFIVGDPLRLRQVLTNLLSNAIKFAPGGRVCVRAQGNGSDSWTLEVEDNGPGIASATLSRLFQPFQQATTSTARSHGGTGLGLSIVKQLAELMGGTVYVRSKLGHGSCFGVELPLRAWDPTHALAQQGRDAPVGPSDPVNIDHHLAPKHLLLAEDNSVNQEVIVRQLRRLGHTCDCANNGEQAWEMLHASHAAYDALITDGDMPRLDGYALIQRVRAWEHQQGTDRLPILMMTANALQGERERCLGLGADEYLSKPTHQRQLQRSLALLISSSSDPETITAGPVEATSSAMAPGSKPYTLLHQLCDHDLAVVRRVLVIFIESTEAALAQLAQARLARDSGEARRLAHRLVSGCLQLEEHAAQQALLSLEGASSDEEVFGAYPAIERALKHALIRARAFLGEGEVPEASQGQSE